MSVQPAGKPCPFNMDDRMDFVERELRDVKTTIVVLDERQQRMHEDFKGLTEALKANTRSLHDIHSVMSNRKGFLAGAVTVVTLLSGALTAALGAMFDWFK